MQRNVLGLLLLLPMVACDDAAASLLEPFTSETDARAAVSAMISALSETQPEAQHQGETVLRGAGDIGGQIIDVSVPCAGGGSIAFEGSLEIENVDAGIGEDFDPFDPNDLPTEADVPSVGFTYSVIFDGCMVEGVVLDGSLDYALETGWNEGAGMLDASWSYGGTIDVSGDVSGQCAFDFGGTGALDAGDWAGGLPDAFTGEACGFDAEGLLDEDS